MTRLFRLIKSGIIHPGVFNELQDVCKLFPGTEMNFRRLDVRSVECLRGFCTITVDGQTERTELSQTYQLTFCQQSRHGCKQSFDHRVGFNEAEHCLATDSSGQIAYANCSLILLYGIKLTRGLQIPWIHTLTNCVFYHVAKAF